MVGSNERVPVKRSEKAVRPRSERRDKKPRTVTQDLQELGGMAGEMAGEKVNQWRTSASDAYRDGRDSLQRGGRHIEQFIREQPVKSILIAAGVGMLLGGLWMRR